MDNANENPMKKLNNKTLSIYGYGQVPMAGSFIYYKSTKKWENGYKNHTVNR